MTPAFRKACEKALDCCNNERLTVEFLEELVKVAPEWADRVAELRSKLDHTDAVANAGIMIMDTMKG